MTMFREGGKDAPVSMRRVLAFAFASASIAAGFVAIPSASAGWHAFLPSMAFGVLSVVLLFFTTWTDIALVVEKAKG